MLWRHGDVLLATTDKLPRGAKQHPAPVLVRGELTGHSHRIADPDSAEVWERNGMLYLKVTAPTATIIHEEHHPITLPSGCYRVWTQREYTPLTIRQIRD